MRCERGVKNLKMITRFEEGVVGHNRTEVRLNDRTTFLSCVSLSGVDRNRSTLSNVRGRPQLGWGVDYNRSTLSNVACPRRYAKSNAHNQFAVLSVPHPLRPNRGTIVFPQQRALIKAQCIICAAAALPDNAYAAECAVFVALRCG
jgi:hypothetical protein